MKISIQNHSDAGTVILDAPLIDQLTRGNIIDAPITLLREDPAIWILPTAMQQNGKIYLSHTLVKGHFDDLSDAEYCIVNEHDLFIVPDHLKNNGRHWITNLLHTDEGVIAFLHSEYTGEGDFFGMQGIMFDERETRAPGRSAIGLAWLPKDRYDAEIYQFDYLGHIATYCSDVPHFNVSGTPMYVNTDEGVEYINILFSDVHATQNDKGWWKDKVMVAHARASLKDVVADAKKGKVSNWLKRNGDAWGDALGKEATGVLPPAKGYADHRIANGEIIVHSDIATIKPDGSYILIGYVLNMRTLHPSCLVIYSSKDGLNWTFEKTSNERSDGSWSYVKILNKGRRDKKGSYYAIIGYDYGKESRKVYRLEIDIDKPKALVKKKTKTKKKPQSAS